MVRIGTRLAVWAILVAHLAVAAVCTAEEVASRNELRAEMIARVDAILAARWAEAGVAPAPPTTDAEFLRRAYLDLTGVIPKVADVRAFLADTRPDKRARLVERLLATPGHATHMANTWRNIMLPGNVSIEQIQNVVGVQNWLREQFVDNKRYDRVVGDLVVATGGGTTGPALYYTAMELQPEKLAASTARIFLGLQIDCAQCHDHPFDHWKQADFWGYAAFFAQLQQPTMMAPGVPVRLVDLDRGEVKLPDTDEVVAPRYPGGDAVPPTDAGSRRQQLAIWMASRENPYLPRAAVNRVWAHLFGRGLIEPVDDLRRDNPASHPELFDELTEYFVRTEFDLREMLGMLASTRAYQLSSRVTDQPPPPELFAAMAIKPLTAEQLYDSLERALLRTNQENGPFGVLGAGLFNPRRQAFVGKMQSQSRSATEYSGGVLQALTLMNGNDAAEASTATQSGLLAALDTPFFSDEERLQILFLSTLSRMPGAEEQVELGQYVRGNGDSAGSSAEALSDVLWALLNSAEFALNH